MSQVHDNSARVCQRMDYGSLLYRRPQEVTTLLPQDLCEELASDALLGFKNSLIFCEPYILFQSVLLANREDTSASLTDFAKGRLHSLSPSEPWYREWKEFVNVKERTFLHLAAVFGDVPLAYECVRRGMDLNHRGSDGATPLLLAAQMLGTLSRFEEFNSDLGEDEEEKALTVEVIRNGQHRARRIITILIEQGADVDISGNDEIAPFMYVWMALDWPTMELFLRCGARIPLRVKAVKNYHTAADERRLVALRRSIQYLPPRPPRPCPCWSGKLLSECHALGPKPYPLDLMCICGSRKTFRKCCKRRNLETWEEWDEQRQCIKVVSKRGDPMEVFRQRAREKFGLGEDTDGPLECGDLWQVSSAEPDNEFIDFLVSHGLVDPAYIYAGRSLGVSTIPIPWEKQFSKLECLLRSHTWNASVDKYIVMGTDPRPRLEIEQNAKIGLDGGPLFKHCEAENCTAIEGTDAKMKCCGRCKRIYYCSTRCQRAHWMNHKGECKDGSHPMQMLRSQKTTRYILEMSLDSDDESGSEFGSDSEISSPEESDYETSEAEGSDGKIGHEEHEEAQRNSSGNDAVDSDDNRED